MPAPASGPELAVVMPVYNEEACVGGAVAEWAEALDAAATIGNLIIHLTHPR